MDKRTCSQKASKLTQDTSGQSKERKLTQLKEIRERAWKQVKTKSIGRICQQRNQFHASRELLSQAHIQDHCVMITCELNSYCTSCILFILFSMLPHPHLFSIPSFLMSNDTLTGFITYVSFIALVRIHELIWRHALTATWSSDHRVNRKTSCKAFHLQQLCKENKNPTMQHIWWVCCVYLSSIFYSATNDRHWNTSRPSFLPFFHKKSLHLKGKGLSQNKKNNNNQNKKYIWYS